MTDAFAEMLATIELFTARLIADDLHVVGDALG